VPCNNGAIYGYEINGKPLPGWSPKNGVGEVISFRQVHSGKEDVLLALNSSGKLVAYDVHGKIKWDVNNLSSSVEGSSIVETESDFAWLSVSANQLTEITADGNDNTRALVDSTLYITTVRASDTSYLYFIAGNAQVRGYDNKGTFNSAISLKGSNITDLDITESGGNKYLLVKDNTAGKVFIYSTTLKPIAEYSPPDLQYLSVTDLFGRGEFIAVYATPDGHIVCSRIR
jgi:hypothetical protein